MSATPCLCMPTHLACPLSMLCRAHVLRCPPVCPEGRQLSRCGSITRSLYVECCYYHDSWWSLAQRADSRRVPSFLEGVLKVC